MELAVLDRYLVVPINPSVGNKKILFYGEDGEIAFDFVAPVDAFRPKYDSFIPVERFIGRTFHVKIEPEAELCCSFAPSLPADDPEMSRRPLVHYTVRRGWLSDPNGLFWYGGIWHMFYQYNPTSTRWGGSLHWGHAVSSDLVRWEERDPVLFPDEDGEIFSGSAFVDSENASGFGFSPAGDPPILLFYTAAGGVSEQSRGKSFTQCLAVSRDGGKTFRKYGKNPVLVTGGRENRDPKVVWAEELGRYVMALYMESDEYALYTSSDLLDWKPLQRLTLAQESECPDFYPLPGEDGKRLWVFSGGEDRYTVGKLTPDGFVPIQSARPHHHGSRCSYAGQTFAFPDEVKSGGTKTRRVRLTYDKMHMPDSPFENQIGIPTDMSLVKTGDIYRLRSWPVPEIETLWRETTEKTDLRLRDGEEFILPLSRCAYDIFIESKQGAFDVTVFGVTLFVDPAENRIVVTSPYSDDYDMPMSYGDGQVYLRVVIDMAGVEIFADRGLVYSSAEVTADFGMSYIRLRTDTGARIDYVRAHALASVYA